MRKVFTYNLIENPTTTPAYVEISKGGWHQNPKDNSFIGIGEITGEENGLVKVFETKEELLSYLNSYTLDWTEQLTLTSEIVRFDATIEASRLWSLL
ncbi:hypothetical protein UFOVP999_57 [uncultured Caudovirales phage]|uniref:Uncharacterized protein n=1 Tax=uncultured Caudovirales phage TaxID=2100421 RepID=A0A6J5Q1V7_9CAUD|nr:hypothetical protein UFOVP999_57 [uncultured Caudovirales phage]